MVLYRSERACRYTYNYDVALRQLTSRRPIVLSMHEWIVIYRTNLCDFIDTWSHHDCIYVVTLHYTPSQYDHNVRDYKISFVITICLSYVHAQLASVRSFVDRCYSLFRRKCIAGAQICFGRSVVLVLLPSIAEY